MTVLFAQIAASLGAVPRDVPALLAESDLVAEVEGTVGLLLTPGALAGTPMSWTATVVRVLKGDPDIEGHAVQWFADRLPGAAAVEQPGRALVFLKANPDGDYELTDRSGGYVPLSAAPPPLAPEVAEPLEAIRAELLHCLRDDDPELVCQAAARLGYFARDQRAEQALIELLDWPGPGFAMTACSSLIRLGVPKGAEAAVELLQAPPLPDPVSWDARDSLVYGVSQLKAERYLSHMLALMMAPEADVRQAAARALGSMPSPKAVKALGEALWDADQMVRYRAITSLQDMTIIRGHVALPTVYTEDEHEYLSFWRKWYEEVGRPAVQQPPAEAEP